jgi:hypothetical protein
MGLTPDQVSACLVTRGDVDMAPILASIRDQGITDIVVWDNSQREDLGAYGRYAAIEEAARQVIYTQDDDLLVPCIGQLIAAYEPGTMTINHPPEWPLDIPWNGKGGIFDRDLPQQAFDRYLAVHPFDRYFTHHVCDGVVGLLNPVKAIYGGHENLASAYQEGRISTSPGWYEERRPLIQERCLALA